MSGDHNMNQKPQQTSDNFWDWFPKATALVGIECDCPYLKIHDAVARDNDRALDLLRRAETEMRYAGWNKYESDNSARNGVYEQIKQFLGMVI
jgi:hypothetical protein